MPPPAQMVPIQGHLERLGRDSETGGAEEGTPVPSTAGCGSGNKKKDKSS